jgi:glyoxylase-like metal-dependent hydrolase (beta-lactamase superfamily II)
MLFDTWYSHHFFTETAPFPFRFYRWITPVTLGEQEDALSQIQKQGFSPEEIRYILLSHLHADHIAGCKDFPYATFICSRIDYEWVRDTKGFQALKRGFVPGLLPEDFLRRVQWIEDGPLISIKERFSPFSHAFDLFSDGSLLAVHLPGHSPGQFGLFLQTESQTVFLAADSCWLKQAYEKNIPPHPIANALTSDVADYKNTLKKVHQLSQQHPEIQIIPSHCLETWEQNQEEWE